MKGRTATSNAREYYNKMLDDSLAKCDELKKLLNPNKLKMQGGKL